MKDYSHIGVIRLELEFTDPDGMAEPSSKTLELHPKQSLQLNIKCPYVSCVNGGFDLTGKVETAIVNKETEIKINSVCQGWQDRRRINKHRCLCHLNCKAEIGYVNT